MRNLGAVLLFLALIGCWAVGSTSSAVADELKVELSGSQDSIRVVVMNTSQHTVRVDTRLAEGPDIGLWDLYLEVRTPQGQVKEYSMKTDGGPGPGPDWQDLWPKHFIGAQISLDWIGEEYNLDQGPYDIIADYRLTSNDGRILQDYHSNTLRVTMGDREHRLTRLEESGEVYDVHLTPKKK